MATVKTQVIDDVKYVIAKFVDEERRISCSCCGCFCDKFKCESIFASFANGLLPTKKNLPPEETIDVEIFNEETNEYEALGTFPLVYHGQFGSGWTDPKPQPISFTTGNGNTITAGWSRRVFCLRFVCRVVSTSGENGVVICSDLTCGPSLNELDLTEKLFEDLGENEQKTNLLSNETESGVYVYCFEFFGLRRPQWENLNYTESISADNAYKLYSFFYNPN